LCALPQYGIYTDARVCYECFSKSSSRRGGVGNASSAESVSSAADTFSGLNLDNDDASSPTENSAVQSAAAVIECKCGMPLCICEAPKPEPAPVKNISTASSTAQPNPKPKKPESSTKKASANSSSNSSSFLNLGLMSNDINDKTPSDYEVTGEGLREAIKGGDSKAVKNLLSQGVDSNYCDKQGFTLLHLAALFNQTEIALILMDSGANIERKNGQGETPLDCAPPMLQYKMRKRIEELAASQRAE